MVTTQQVDIQVYTFVPLSLLGNIILMYTYRNYKLWRDTMPSAKRVLCCQCLLESIGLTAFLWAPTSSTSSDCEFQAILIQCFWVNSTVINGFMAVETAFLCRALFGVANAQTNLLAAFKAKRDSYVWRRYLCYTSLFCVVGLAEIIFIVDLNKYDKTAINDDWCWVATNYEKLVMGYGPIWLGMILSGLSVIYMITLIYNKVSGDVNTDSVRSNRSSQDSINSIGQTALAPRGLVNIPSIRSTASGRQSSSKRISLRDKVLRSFRRVILHLSVFIVVWIPGSIRRGSLGKVDSEILTILNFTVLTFGILKFIIWVICDPKVFNWWKYIILSSIGYDIKFQEKPQLKSEIFLGKQLSTNANLSSIGVPISDDNDVENDQTVNIEMRNTSSNSNSSRNPMQSHDVDSDDEY